MRSRVVTLTCACLALCGAKLSVTDPALVVQRLEAAAGTVNASTLNRNIIMR